MSKFRLDIIDAEDLYSEIIRKRNEQKLSQHDLANKVGTSNLRICRIENGNINLTIREAEKIFNGFGYSFKIALIENK
jgi:transcriptional regulator with XRE-family HTH domain